MLAFLCVQICRKTECQVVGCGKRHKEIWGEKNTEDGTGNMIQNNKYYNPAPDTRKWRVYMQTGGRGDNRTQVSHMRS